ncbi:uncharacterized protein LOC129005927 [Macrosteles quadrilineatus]|uniref:uncharacterized protein LOC128982655 n=1 Tax=Macrosteles quadrilineatus TaxID=74068 RepID=UPI0023E09AD3|nr:uncharacterized protein LOC128982655 [Macrosteles quadrilineatus]XP_054263190.1 uncharacterized protein LOC128986720 [Macrosteles quadrilineatus]XP_054290942.1 uncharacterized protein LOC129005927 [Macrosteles quadrilineatus]
MCNMQFILSTEDDRRESMGINTASVAGAMCIGIGHSQLQELLSSMEIPAMSAVSYSGYHDTLSKGWEDTALEEMKSAATEEIAHAIAEGQVTPDGTPILTVVADGSWAKRSYRTNYNSLSGVAAIVGFNTKKVIFLGVRNKYCTVCARAAKTARPPSEHACFKNWTGSSPGMETDIILEGFSRSMEMYGAMYGKVLADGDSSVYATLYESRPYPHLTIEKIECTNHLLRNFCNKLKEVGQKTSLGPKPLRDVVKKNILRLRTAVTKAVEHRKTNDSENVNNVSSLMKDIINSPSHVFGEHLKCREIGYFCDGPKDNEKNYVPELKEAGIYTEVMSTVGSLADHARSLMMKMNNNTAEHYNSIVAKFIGGKRVNFALKRSYKARCFAAVVSHNSQLPLYKLHKNMYSKSPGKILKRHQLKKKRILEQRALRRIANPNRRKQRQVPAKETSDGIRHYGGAAMKADLPEEIYQIKKQIFLEALQRTEEEKMKLERGTLLQAGSGLWKEERRKLLTASNFGIVCKRRKSTSCAGLVKNLLYRDVQTPSMFYGRENETQALTAFEKKTGLTVSKCGLFVDKDIPYLGATPDGLVGDDCIVEVKCPASCSELTPEEGILRRKFTFWDVSRNKTEVEAINKKHNYFYQVQGQLHITQRKYCYFVMWTPKGMRMDVIEKDDEFWDSHMRDQLQDFYLDCLLPELVDPRQTRSMSIRNPQYILEAMEQAKLKRK